jgi:UDP-glucose 4-epimerase
LPVRGTNFVAILLGVNDLKVLITGGAGFIGSHLCDSLINAGAEVIILDDFSSGQRENIAHLDGRVRLIEASVLDIARHREALTGVTRIYHLAALISGYDSLHEPEAYVDTNLVGLLRLIEVARTLPGVRIIFASSSTVYGNNLAPVCSETSEVNPLTMYALSKLTGEHTLRLYGELHGFDHVSLRLFNVYGPRQSPNHPYANVTCKFSYAAATGGGVQLYGDGEQSRDFVFVDDVVEALMLVSEPGSRHKIYNVGTGAAASIKTLLREVEKLAGSELEVKRHAAWANDIHWIRADVFRLEQEFGYRPRVTLADGLARTVEYFRRAQTATSGDALSRSGHATK